MAGRPKRRARIAAQWAEVDRAAGRTSNAGRPKRRARLAAEAAAARGTVSVPAAAPSAALTDLIAARDAAAARCRRAEKQYYAAKGTYRAAQRNDYIDESDLMDAEREYYATTEALQDAKNDLTEANKALAAARRTPNAGRPKRRARIAAQWAEVDRAAGVKVPRAKRKKNGGLSSRWLVFKGGKRPSRAHSPYVLLSTQPETGGKTRGTHLYCLIGGTGVDQWDACSYDSFEEDAREGFSWWGTQVSLDDVPEPYRSSILKRAGHYERMAAGGTRDTSSAYASREERLAAMPSYRKRTQNPRRSRSRDDVFFLDRNHNVWQTCAPNDLDAVAFGPRYAARKVPRSAFRSFVVVGYEDDWQIVELH